MEILTNAMLLEQSNCLELGPMIRCYSFFPMEDSHPNYSTAVGGGRDLEEKFPSTEKEMKIKK
jgi:hypothetical protein